MSGAVENYTYDSQNRLVGYASDVTTASYAYDAMDRRIAKTVDGDITAYVYDSSVDNPPAHDDILLEYDGTFLMRRWAHSAAVDEPLGFEEYFVANEPGAGLESAMFADRQGSILYVTDPASDQIQAAYEYDGFGAITQTQGALQQPYGYTGREYDAESGLYYYRARSYDPATGMFVQSDPIGFGGGTMALYSYVSNNSYRWNDPKGLTQSVPFAIDSNISAAEATAVGFGFATAAVLLASRISRDLSKIHIAPGSALRNQPEGTGPPPPPPPGDCTRRQLDRMQSAKNRANARARSCAPQDSLGTLMWNRARLEELRFRRATIMAVCFRGGDRGHRIALAQVQTRIDTCNAIIASRGPRHGL